MAETWYEVVDWSNEIRPAQVDKVTDSYVVIGTRRHVKRGSYSSYFPSEIAALTSIVERLTSQVRVGRDKLARGEDDLAKFTARLKELTQ